MRLAMKSKAELCILILQYNSADLTLQLLDSIVEHDYVHIDHYRIIVMDNASKEPKIEEITGRFPFIEFVHYEENLGFARAHNRVMQNVHENWVLLLNNDCILLNNAIEKLLQSAKDKEADFATCEVFNADGTPQNNYSYLPSPLRRIFIGFTGIGRMMEPIRRRMSAVRIGYINGAVLLIKNEVFKNVGMFDEKFFMYCEDLDLMLKLSMAGYRGYRLQGGRIVHLGGASAERISSNWDLHEKNQYDWFSIYGSYFPTWQIFLFAWAELVTGYILQPISKRWRYRRMRAQLTLGDKKGYIRNS